MFDARGCDVFILFITFRFIKKLFSLFLILSVVHNLQTTKQKNTPYFRVCSNLVWQGFSVLIQPDTLAPKSDTTVFLSSI